MFDKIIYTAIERNHEADMREGVGISQIGYCELKTQNFFVKKMRPNIPVDRLLAMLTGTATHEHIFKLLWKFRGEIGNFIYKKREVEVFLPTPKGSIKGHLDLMAEVDGQLEVIDLKVVDFGAFGYITSEKSREHEYDQINCYAAAAGIENCRLTYLCKGGKTTTADVKEYAFKTDHARVEELKLKYDRIMAGEAVKPFTEPTWECNICPFYTECWGVKVYQQKSPGVVALDAELEEKFIAAKFKLDEIDAEVEELKKQLQTGLDGKRGEGYTLSISFVAPRSYDSIDAKAAQKILSAEDYKKVARPKDSAGYYKFNIRR